MKNPGLALKKIENMKTQKFIIKTLGCKVNQYESQVLRENLSCMGFKDADTRKPDVCIINSCTVTDSADRKTRKLIRQIKKENPKAIVLVTGCYAVLEDDIKILESMPETGMVISGKNKNEIPDIVSRLFYKKEPKHGLFHEQVSGFKFHTRAFLKIQDGCEQGCSYCKVTLVRRPSVCKKKNDIIREVKALVEKGYKEIVLTGICLGAWKGENSEDLTDILKEISQINENFRIRLSSIEPNFITRKLINCIAGSSKICRHLHIPLQSGSDTVLKAMNRRYTSEQFKNIVGMIQKEIPGIGITMDVMTGFPGEKEKDFKKTLELLDVIKPSRMHIFTYSERKGTIAFNLGNKVSLKISKDRARILKIKAKALQMKFYHDLLGKDVEVLVENKDKNGIYTGYTSEYVKVKIFSSTVMPGEIVKVKVGSSATAPALKDLVTLDSSAPAGASE